MTVVLSTFMQVIRVRVYIAAAGTRTRVGDEHIDLFLGKTNTGNCCNADIFFGVGGGAFSLSSDSGLGIGGSVWKTAAEGTSLPVRDTGPVPGYAHYPRERPLIPGTRY